MKDTRLREAFAALCQHLNVRKVEVGEDVHFIHESRYDESRPCKILRKADLDKLKKQITELQESVSELRRNKR